MEKKHRRFWLRFDRLLSHNLIKQLMFLGILMLVLFVISFGLLSVQHQDWHSFCNKNNIPFWLMPVYLLIDTNALNVVYTECSVNGWTLFASSFTYLLGVCVFNGMIISLLTNAISRRVERYREGLIHYLESGHYIIMGYDNIVPSIIDDIFRRDDKAYILILTSVKAPTIRERLRRTLGEHCLKRVIINYGHRTSPDEYAALHLEAAEEIFIAGCRQLPAHDAINIECVDSICTYLGQLPQDKKHSLKRITCVFEDLDTYAAFKTSEIFGAVGRLGIQFVPYNFYTDWAKQVFVNRCHKEKRNPQRCIDYPAVYGNGITPDDPRHVHLVFVGTTNFAVAFAIEAAHALHFPNFNGDKSRRTRITFIDRNADKEQHVFITRNRHFFDVQQPLYTDLSGDVADTGSDDCRIVPADDRNFLDVEFEFIKGDVFAPAVQQRLREWARDPKQYLSIFLAMVNQRDNFAIGMNMPDEIYDCRIPVFIRQDRSDNFVTNLRRTDSAQEFIYSFVDSRSNELCREKRHGRYACIYPFGMNDTAYSSDDAVLKRAKLINWLYSIDKSSDPDTLEPDFQQIEEKWNDRSVAEKWSNFYNAYSIPCKLASLRAMRGLDPDDTSRDMQPLTGDEIRTLAEVEHNRWNVEKLLMGFRRPRPEEDKYLMDKRFEADLKENRRHFFIHHDIRPYDKLDNVKEQDSHFAKFLPWILKNAPSR